MIPEKLVRRRVDAINTGDYQALAGFEAFPDMCVLRRGTSGTGRAAGVSLLNICHLESPLESGRARRRSPTSDRQNFTRI